jgi:hypothetical protein
VVRPYCFALYLCAAQRVAVSRAGGWNRMSPLQNCEIHLPFCLTHAENGNIVYGFSAVYTFFNICLLLSTVTLLPVCTICNIIHKLCNFLTVCVYIPYDFHYRHRLFSWEH